MRRAALWRACTSQGLAAGFGFYFLGGGAGFFLGEEFELEVVQGFRCVVPGWRFAGGGVFLRGLESSDGPTREFALQLRDTELEDLKHSY